MSDTTAKSTQRSSAKKKSTKTNAARAKKTNDNQDQDEKVGIESIPFFNLQGRFVHVTVGNEDRPAGDSDIEDIRNKLEELAESNNIDCLFFVTHHAVNVKFIA